MPRSISSYFTLILVILLGTFILWFPFLFRMSGWFGLNIVNPSFDYVYRHFDGPLYVIAAKTLYNPKAIEIIGLEIPLSPNYFAAHLPLYPLLIKVFAPLMGYLKSMIYVTQMSALLLGVFFFFMLKHMKLTKNPFLLTLVFLFLPRFLVVRSVGAPEPLFLFFVLLSLFSFEKKNYLFAGLMGGLATMTKTPGALLFFAYGLVFVEHFLKKKEIDWRWSGVLFIPLGLLAVFLLYFFQYGDFFAYFHSGDNIHLISPFSAFNFQKPWVNTAWLEEIIFYFFLYLLSIFTLKDSPHRSFYYFSLIFFTATIFVQHRDISRYSLPLWPLACIAFESFFTSKKFKWVFILLLPAIYLYAWNFLLFNVMTISNWAPFL